MKESEKLTTIARGLIETAGYGAASNVAKMLGVQPAQISKAINADKPVFSELTLKTNQWVNSSHDDNFKSLELLKEVHAYGYTFRVRKAQDDGEIVTWSTT